MYSADVIESHSAQVDVHMAPEGALADNRAVIILIPVRLGGEKINPEYFNFVKVRLVSILAGINLTGNSLYMLYDIPINGNGFFGGLGIHVYMNDRSGASYTYRMLLKKTWRKIRTLKQGLWYRPNP